ncbi:MAG: TIGR00282 family metallophosphoesterase [Candidatus Eisenbacteria bacterium]|nr:TIGR00282 family metallophosphoesterase [Candidatus Eisenbacteria bacterium]
MTKILFVADVFGKPGRNVLSAILPTFIAKNGVDFCIANGENAAAGKGLTPEIASLFFQSGVDVITGGNHLWDKKEVFQLLGNDQRVIRPANYPPGVPGPGAGVFTARNKKPVGVMNLLGRTFIREVDCPFRVALSTLEFFRDKTQTIVIDFHGEATSEKTALGWFLDGKVSAVIGTHTHVQTADERILPNGTAYITDAGMTGPFDSVIGVKKEMAIRRFLTQLPERFEPATDDLRLNAVFISVDGVSGKSTAIERIEIKLDDEY